MVGRLFTITFAGLKADESAAQNNMDSGSRSLWLFHFPACRTGDIPSQLRGLGPSFPIDCPFSKSIQTLPFLQSQCCNHDGSQCLAKTFSLRIPSLSLSSASKTTILWNFAVFLPFPLFALPTSAISPEFFLAFRLNPRLTKNLAPSVPISVSSSKCSLSPDLPGPRSSVGVYQVTPPLNQVK